MLIVQPANNLFRYDVKVPQDSKSILRGTDPRDSLDSAFAKKELDTTEMDRELYGNYQEGGR